MTTKLNKKYLEERLGASCNEFVSSVCPALRLSCHQCTPPKMTAALRQSQAATVRLTCWVSLRTLTLHKSSSARNHFLLSASPVTMSQPSCFQCPCTTVTGTIVVCLPGHSLFGLIFYHSLLTSSMCRLLDL